VPNFICDIADAVFDRSGRQATSGVSLVSDGRSVSFGDPARVPKREGVSVMAADNAFAAAVSAKAMRGYDAAQKERLAPGAQFDPTTVMNKTWAPERPQAGGGNTGHEP
jgi:sugar/nucleoside kinase (ribokinase family)